MPEQKSTGLTIGVFTREDVAAAAALHKANFPDDLFTLAGDRVLVRLFQEFLNEVSLAAKLDGRLIGYSVGTLDKPRFMKRMALRHMPALASGIGLAVLGRAYEAPGYVRGLVRWLAAPRPPARFATAVSMYEAISKDARGLGVSPLFFLVLHARWIVYAERLGAQQIEGQVTDDRMLAALSRLGYGRDRTVRTRTGHKHYIRCRLPAEGAYRWSAQGGADRDGLQEASREAATAPAGHPPI